MAARVLTLVTSFAIVDARIAGQACHDFGFMRKMRTWSHRACPTQRTSVLRNRLEHRPRRGCSDPGASAHGNGGVMPNLLATHLRLPAAQWPAEARRRRFNAIILPAPVGKRDAPARFAGEGTL